MLLPLGLGYRGLLCFAALYLLQGGVIAVAYVCTSVLSLVLVFSGLDFFLGYPFLFSFRSCLCFWDWDTGGFLIYYTVPSLGRGGVVAVACYTFKEERGCTSILLDTPFCMYLCMYYFCGAVDCRIIVGGENGTEFIPTSDLTPRL